MTTRASTTRTSNPHLLVRLPRIGPGAEAALRARSEGSSSSAVESSGWMAAMIFANASQKESRSRSSSRPRWGSSAWARGHPVLRGFSSTASKSRNPNGCRRVTPTTSAASRSQVVDPARFESYFHHRPRCSTTCARHVRPQRRGAAEGADVYAHPKPLSSSPRASPENCMAPKPSHNFPFDICTATTSTRCCSASTCTRRRAARREAQELPRRRGEAHDAATSPR